MQERAALKNDDRRKSQHNTDGKIFPAVVNDLRITKVGKIIWSTRIDELPQIFNIL